MKRTRKILRNVILWFSILSLLLPTLVACQGTETPQPEPPSQTVEKVTTEKKPTPEPPDTEVTLTADNAKNYLILMPTSCKDPVKDAALNLFAGLEDAGFKLKNCTYDGGSNSTEIPEDACEILIGLTNRSESMALAKGLRMNDFAIAAEGDRIMIVGGSDQATADGVAYFLEHYVNGQETVSVLEKYFAEGEYDLATLTDITANDRPISDYHISLCASINPSVLHAASLLSAAIAEKTAYALPIKTEEKASGMAIRLELSDALAETEYAYTIEDDCWVIRGTDRTLLFAVRTLIKQINESVSGTVELNAFIADNATMETQTAPTHPTLEGKLPVALCDQQNAQAVIIDLAAADPASSSAILWTWAPTSANGFTAKNYKQRIDECKLRYSEVLEKYVVCVTSSSGFMGLAEYPSGKKIWEDDAPGYGPHSIDYLPNGTIAVVLSGNGRDGNQEIRIYACDEGGKPTQNYVREELLSAHGVAWDNEWGVLWALGDTELIAYEIGGTAQEPTLTRIAGMGSVVKSCGHDLSVSPVDPGKLLLSSNTVYVFDKFKNSLTSTFDGSNLICSGAVKCIAQHTDGSILRTVAANVYASHDTDTINVFRLNDSGEWVKTDYKFTNRAFYKARPFILY